MASRKLEDAHPDLQKVFVEAKKRWAVGNPHLPYPVLTATYRSNTEQTSLYNQPTDGKDNDGDGKVDERDEKVTNAKAGQSAHNFYPSRALDVAFVLGNKTYWDAKYYIAFSEYMLKAAQRLGVKITWGGHFKSLTDYPHYELTGWKSL